MSLLKRSTLTVILIFVSCFSYGQTNSVTKKEIVRLFKIDEGQNSKSWTICNQGDTFFKTDTLYFYDSINYFYQSGNCCEFVQWDFSKKNFFVQKKLQVCKEPSTSEVITEKNYYSIKPVSEKGQILLKKYHKNELVETFLVATIKEIDLKENRKCQRLAIIRLHSPTYR